MALELAPDEPPLEARDDPPAGDRPRHTTRLLELIVGLLEQSGSSFDRLEKLAVGVGPGSFTGLRVGIATARALAQARDLPLVGVSTLHSLALGAEQTVASQSGLDAVVPVIDARRGEVFAAAWSPHELAGAPFLEPRALAPAALGHLLAQANGARPHRTLAFGDGALAFRGALERSGVLIPEDDAKLHRVTAVNHCRLARSLSPREPDAVQPAYLRLPDAERLRHAAL